MLVLCAWMKERQKCFSSLVVEGEEECLELSAVWEEIVR